MDGLLHRLPVPARVSVATAAWDDALAARPPFVLRAHIVPVVLTMALAAGALSWNLGAGFVLHPTPLVALGLNAALFAVAFVYARFRLSPLVAELALYFGLWLTFPAFATLLSYLCIAIGLPLQDPALEAADAALGFHWTEWDAFVTRHPFFLAVQGRAYFSLVWQALLSIAIFSIWRPGQRNAELLTGMLVGVLVTLRVASSGTCDRSGVMRGRAPNWLPTFLAVRLCPHRPTCAGGAAAA